MKLRPYSVAIVVKDRRKALRWYTTKLGLDVLERHEHWTVVGSRRGGIALHLCQTSEYLPRSKARLEPGNSGVLLTVDGPIERAYRTLRKRGVRFPHPPEKMPWGWHCVLADPDGNEFSLAPDDA